MKYFYTETMTMYDGLNFVDKSLQQGESEEEIQEYLSQDGVVLHEDSGEELDQMRVIEISKDHFDILKLYI